MSPSRRVFKVTELCGVIDVALGELFPDAVWVQGEISGSRPPNRAGHRYFDLVEKDARGSGIRAKLGAALFRRAAMAVGRKLRAAGNPFKLEDGVVVRVLARVEFYPPHGRLQLIVDDVDLEFTIGRMALDRAAVLRRLKAAGLLDRQKQLAPPEVPLRIGLVSGRGTAAYRDFWETIAHSGLGFEVTFCPATMEGRASERQVVAALRCLARRPVDAIALVRGGGARDTLAWFDSERICQCIAAIRVPIFTGIGHATDLSLADEVAHVSLKTPTAVAEELVRRVRAWVDRRDALVAEICDGARRIVAARKTRLLASARGVGDATRTTLAAESKALATARRDLRPAAQAVLDRQRVELVVRSDQLAEHGGRSLRAARLAWRRARDELSVPRLAVAVRDRRRFLAAAAERVRAAATDRVVGARHRVERGAADLAHPAVLLRVGRLGEEADRTSRAVLAEAARLLARERRELAEREQQVRLLSPQSTLARGFSITYGPGGRAIRSPEQAPPGTPLRTRVAGGSIHSVASKGSEDNGEGEERTGGRGAEVRPGDGGARGDPRPDPR